MLMIAIATALLTGDLPRATPVVFPGDRDKATAPDGRASIVWKNHDLSYEDREGHIYPLKTFERHANVLWSPDSRMAAISISDASDSSSLYIYSISYDSQPSASAIGWPDDVRLALSENDHAYVDVHSWSASGLYVRVRAYSLNPLDRTLVCKPDLAGGMGCTNPATIDAEAERVQNP